MTKNWCQKLDTHKSDLCVGLIIFIAALATFLFSPVYVLSDSKYALVVSESLIKHRSFAVDHFALPRLEPQDNGNYVGDGRIYQLEWAGNRLYYYLPPGSSVFSLPYVALMDFFGVSVINEDGTYNVTNEVKLQTILAAFLMALLASIFYFTSRLVLPKTWSVAVAIGGALGTQVWSTLSRALWSDTWGVVLLGLIIWMLLTTELRKAQLHAVLLGTLLAWTYFVRPTNAIPVFAIAIYVFVCHRRSFVRFAATALIWLALFVLYAWYNFDKALPNYYLASRLTFEHFGEALAGNLVSPARGLLIYVPVFLFIFYVLARYRNKIAFPRLVILSGSIITVHWITTSGFPHWWGGYSYGPRLMAGVVPWLVLLAIVGIDALLRGSAGQPVKAHAVAFQKIEKAMGALLLFASVAMNGIGATMAAPLTWNERPISIEKRPRRLWDWRYPQFLAGFILPPRPDVFPPADVRIECGGRAAEPYLWYGWRETGDTYRWTEGHEATVIFALDEIAEAQLRMKVAPLIVAGKLDQQRVKIAVNGKPIETLTLKDPDAHEYSLTLPKDALQRNNVLSFGLPDAATPKSLNLNTDTLSVALAVFWLEIKTESTSAAQDDQKRTMATESLPNGGYAAEIEAINPPTELETGETANLKVKVKNVSGAIWPTNGQNDGTDQVHLGDHWLDANGRMVIMDDARAALPYDIRPGREIELLLTIKAPQTPGDYILELDMVQERVNWFADEEEESRPARMKIAVR